jgi:maleylpyruvate isomerase
VTADPLVLVEDVERATARLLTTAAALDGVATPSLLPGWSRGHVLTHVARNADGLCNLLYWARTGEKRPQYPSWAAREADIEAGAGRPLDQQLADMRDSAARFAQAAAEMPASAWLVDLPLDSGPQRAARVVWRRLREVEMHHVDLGAGYEPADWPEAFTHRLLHELTTSMSSIDLTLHSPDLGHPLVLGNGGPPTVTGACTTLAGWLTGRIAKPDLALEPTGPLPALPDWL